MKRLIAFPLIFAVFFGPIGAMPGHGTGSVEAATVVSIDVLPVDGDIVAQEEPAEDEATEDTPWAVVLPLAFGIPLAVLLLPAFLRKRSLGH
jgi:hypothetical protein